MAHARAQFLRKIKTEKIAVSDTNLRAPSSSEGNIKNKIKYILKRLYNIDFYLIFYKIYLDIFYVESLDRARRKRQVSKEIKVAAEENDFDVKGGAL